MKRLITTFTSIVLAHSVAAAPPDLSKVDSSESLDGVIAAEADPALKQALRDNAAAILAAAGKRPHVDAVIRTIDSAPGKYEKINATPESLRKAAGGDIALFDTLKLVDLSIPNAGAHDHRKADPYDAAFFEHVGHLSSLESLNIIATKLNDDWIAPIGKLTNLRTLRFTNNGKLTDAGLDKLAGLKNLEAFSFVGTGMKGHAYAKFEGWTKLVRVSHRGSSIDDEGLKQLCDHLPNLESISLAHAKFTDAGAVHLAKLKRLRSLEIGTRNATPACLKNLSGLPLESLQLGDGLDSPEGIAAVKSIATLRTLSITNGKPLTDADLALLASLTQLENLIFDKLPLPDERIPQLAAFSSLKSISFALRPTGYPEETQAKVKAVLPKVEVKFVK